MLTLARNPERSTDRALLLESLVRDRSTYYGHPYAAIRSGHFLYVDYATGDEELYNLARDPDQLRSVAGEPRYADKQRALSAALDELRDCRGTGCEVTVAASGQPEARRAEETRLGAARIAAARRYRLGD